MPTQIIARAQAASNPASRTTAGGETRGDRIGWDRTSGSAGRSPGRGGVADSKPRSDGIQAPFSCRGAIPSAAFRGSRPDDRGIPPPRHDGEEKTRGQPGGAHGVTGRSSPRRPQSEPERQGRQHHAPADRPVDQEHQTRNLSRRSPRRSWLTPPTPGRGRRPVPSFPGDALSARAVSLASMVAQITRGELPGVNQPED